MTSRADDSRIQCNAEGANYHMAGSASAPAPSHQLEGTNKVHGMMGRNAEMGSSLPPQRMEDEVNESAKSLHKFHIHSGTIPSSSSANRMKEASRTTVQTTPPVPNKISPSSQPTSVSITPATAQPPIMTPSPASGMANNMLSPGFQRSCDFTFLVGSDNPDEAVLIHAHKTVIAAKSPFFLSLFEKHPACDSITEAQISPSVLTELLSFMYTDKCAISMRNILQIVVNATKYQLPQLVLQCEEALKQQIHLGRVDIEDCALLLEVSKAHIPNSMFLRICYRFVVEHFNLIMTAESFGDFSKDTLLAILSENHLPCPEIDLFRGIVRWGLAQLHDADVNDMDILEEISSSAAAAPSSPSFAQGTAGAATLTSTRTSPPSATAIAAAEAEATTIPSAPNTNLPSVLPEGAIEKFRIIVCELIGKLRLHLVSTSDLFHVVLPSTLVPESQLLAALFVKNFELEKAINTRQASSLSSS